MIIHRTESKYNQAKRIIAVMTLVCFIAFSIGTIILTIEHAEHADHNCAAGHCEVCLHLHHLREIAKHLLPVMGMFLVAFLALSQQTGMCSCCSDIHPDTLVARKIRLNN